LIGLRRVASIGPETHRMFRKILRLWRHALRWGFWITIRLACCSLGKSFIFRKNFILEDGRVLPFSLDVGWANAVGAVWRLSRVVCWYISLVTRK
jgi:hypothetical protein